MSVWRGSLIAVLMFSGTAVLATVQPVSGQVPESLWCALVDDPANGLDGVQTASQEIGPTAFDDGERILITVDEPSPGGVVGIRVLLGGTSNLDAPVAALPATVEVWGLGPVMRWETVDGAGVAAVETVTWYTECIPAPGVPASPECRGESSAIIISIDDQSPALGGAAPDLGSLIAFTACRSSQR